MEWVSVKDHPEGNAGNPDVYHGNAGTMSTQKSRKRMNLTQTMAYAGARDMTFGSCLYPVTTKSGMCIGGGQVVPEIVVHPRTGSEVSLKTLLREFERGYDDALERCVSIGIPGICLEIEHVAQMTRQTDWGEAFSRN